MKVIWQNVKRFPESYWNGDCVSKLPLLVLQIFEHFCLGKYCILSLSRFFMAMSSLKTFFLCYYMKVLQSNLCEEDLSFDRLSSLYSHPAEVRGHQVNEPQGGAQGRSASYSKDKRVNRNQISMTFKHIHENIIPLLVSLCELICSLLII